MSKAVFDYSALEKAGNQAKKAAGALEDYSEELEKKVSRKLDSYGGPCSGNVSNVSTLIRQKRSVLAEKAERLIGYGSELKNLVQNAKSADTNVREQISTLAEQFAERHGIHISTWEYNMALSAVRRDNSNKVSRWLSDQGDGFNDWISDKVDRLSYWYQYEGGKYIIWENVKAVLKGALAVVSLIAAAAAFLAGGGLLVFIAATFLAVMTLFDAVTDIVYNCKAAAIAKDDPVMAVRLDGVNDYTDMIRRESNERWIHSYCNALDFTETICSVITFVTGLKGMAKAGYKWLADGSIDIKTFNLKDMKWSSIKSGITGKFGNLVDGINKFKTQIMTGDFSSAGMTIKTSAMKWWEYVKLPFADANEGLSNLHNTTDAKGLKDALSGIKFYLSIPKTIFSDGVGEYVKGLIGSGFAVGDISDSNNVITLDDVKSNVWDKAVSYYGKFEGIYTNVSGSDFEQNIHRTAERVETIRNSVYFGK